MPAEMMKCAPKMQSAAMAALEEAGVDAANPVLDAIRNFLSQYGPVAVQALLSYILSLIAKPLPTPAPAAPEK